MIGVMSVQETGSGTLCCNHLASYFFSGFFSVTRCPSLIFPVA